MHTTTATSPRSLPLPPPTLSRKTTDFVIAQDNCQSFPRIVLSSAEDTSSDLMIAMTLQGVEPPKLSKAKTDVLLGEFEQEFDCSDVQLHNLQAVLTETTAALPPSLPTFERAATDFVSALLESAQTQAAIEDGFAHAAAGDSHEALPHSDPQFRRIPTDLVHKQQLAPSPRGAPSTSKHDRRPSGQEHQYLQLSALRI